MCRHHGHELQQRGSRNGGEHVSEVGGCRHLDVLDHIGVGLTAFNNTALQDHQVFLQKNDIRGLFCNVNGGINGDTDISAFKCGGIVNTITHETNYMSVVTKDLNDTRFLVRIQLGKHLCIFSQRCKLII